MGSHKVMIDGVSCDWCDGEVQAGYEGFIGFSREGVAMSPDTMEPIMRWFTADPSRSEKHLCIMCAAQMRVLLESYGGGKP